MRILLLNPYFTLKSPDRAYPAEPLGLMSVATYLIRESEAASIDIDMKIVDAMMMGPDQPTSVEYGFRSGMTDEELRLLLDDYKPDLVGISNNYTAGLCNVLGLSCLTRQVLPDALIVVGGAHATLDHEELIKKPSIDVVVRSEGEETFKELVFALFRGESLNGIQGITHECGGHVIVEEDRDLIEDINTLPVPDRSLIAYEDYLKHTAYCYALTKNSPVATIFTSRGCPYKCIFCSTQRVWRNKWRARSAENVLAEIKYLHDTYGANEIAFQDDQLIGDKNRMKDLCRLLIRENMGISIIAPPGISPALVDAETLVLMRKAGFYRICLSIDVGSKQAQSFVRKPVNLDAMRGIVRKANSIGLWTYATFVIGFPDETIEDVQQTVKYAYGLKLDHVIFYIAQPYLGSELYQIYLAEGLIDRDVVNQHHLPSESLYGTKNISAADLERLRDSAAGRYRRHHFMHFFDPVYVLTEFVPKLWGIRNFLYFLRLMCNLRLF